MKGPKVVLIGAGSTFFGRQTVWSMVMKEALHSGTLALVDPDEKKLGWMAKIARRAIDARKVPLKLEVATNRKRVLKGADFVILAFAVEGVKLRGVDADISTKHGMTMCSADTAGPGGIMRTVREVPRQNRILKDVEKLCPDAWVINWTNPTAAMGIAMMRHFPHLRRIAICDGPHNPRFDDDLIVRAGLAKSADKITDALRSRVSIYCTGVNHFSWLIEMTHKGKELGGKVIESFKGNAMFYQLAKAMGYAPMCFWHTQEYLPFFMGHDVDRKKGLKLKKWLVKNRWTWMRECWSDMRKIASGRRGIEDFLEKTTPDHASDIIEAMWAGLNKTFYINTENNGAVPNMPDDAFLELLSAVDMNRISPLPSVEIPPPLLGYVQRVLDEHELAVEAGVTFDRQTLRQAFLASMTAVSIPDIDNCIDEMLRRERQYLDKKWARQKKN